MIEVEKIFAAPCFGDFFYARANGSRTDDLERP